jgi:hypothetical protein
MLCGAAASDGPHGSWVGRLCAEIREECKHGAHGQSGHLNEALHPPATGFSMVSVPLRLSLECLTAYNSASGGEYADKICPRDATTHG